MKPLRLGKSGAEQPGLLDSGGQLRELSAILTDIAGSSLLPESLDKLRQLNPRALPLVSGSPRLGSMRGFRRQSSSASASHIRQFRLSRGAGASPAPHSETR